MSQRPAIAAVLDGLVDMHVHSGPSPFPRRLDHVEAAQDGARIGMRAMVAKSHHHNTQMDILAMKGLRLGMVTPEHGEDDADEDEIVGLESLVAEPAVAESTDVRLRSVASLDLSVRSRAALATLGIKTVGDLAGTSEETLLACKNFGQTSLAEVKAKLKDLGLSLAG